MAHTLNILTMLCYVYGKLKLKSHCQSRNKMTVQRSYELYFGCKVGDPTLSLFFELTFRFLSRRLCYVSDEHRERFHLEILPNYWRTLKRDGETQKLYIRRDRKSLDFRWINSVHDILLYLRQTPLKAAEQIL